MTSSSEFAEEPSRAPEIAPRLTTRRRPSFSQAFSAGSELSLSGDEVGAGPRPGSHSRGQAKAWPFLLTVAALPADASQARELRGYFGARVRECDLQVDLEKAAGPGKRPMRGAFSLLSLALLQRLGRAGVGAN